MKTIMKKKTKKKWILGLCIIVLLSIWYLVRSTNSYFFKSGFVIGMNRANKFSNEYLDAILNGGNYDSIRVEYELYIIQNDVPTEYHYDKDSLLDVLNSYNSKETLK